MDKISPRFLIERMIKLTSKSFITHKKAESQDDCQDAWCENKELGRYAVADGATRSFFPKEWAELLAEHFCKTSVLPTIDNWKTWMKPIQEKWRMRIANRVKERPLFYLINSLNSKEPAASTLIGLEFDKDRGRWQAIITGDSCLFHIGACGFESFVIAKSADFTSHPEVFASYEKDNHSEPTYVKGDAMHGDTFILATDALAKWILEHEEAGIADAALSNLKQIQNETQFKEFIERARSNEDIRLVNDDVTLMIISVEPDQPVNGEEAQPSTVATSGNKLNAERLSNFSRLLFWVLLAGMLGFFVGGLSA